MILTILFLRRVAYLCEALSVALTSNSADNYFYILKLVQTVTPLTDSTENSIDSEQNEFMLRDTGSYSSVRKQLTQYILGKTPVILGICILFAAIRRVLQSRLLSVVLLLPLLSAVSSFFYAVLTLTLKHCRKKTLLRKLLVWLKKISVRLKMSCSEVFCVIGLMTTTPFLVLVRMPNRVPLRRLAAGILVGVMTGSGSLRPFVEACLTLKNTLGRAMYDEWLESDRILPFPLYYAIFGLDQNGFDQKDLVDAYKALVDLYNTDALCGNSEVLRLLAEAYLVLSNFEKRERYDEWLSSSGGDAFPLYYVIFGLDEESFTSEDLSDSFQKLMNGYRSGVYGNNFEALRFLFENYIALSNASLRNAYSSALDGNSIGKISFDSDSVGAYFVGLSSDAAGGLGIISFNNLGLIFNSFNFSPSDINSILKNLDFSPFDIGSVLDELDSSPSDLGSILDGLGLSDSELSAVLGGLDLPASDLGGFYFGWAWSF